MGVWLGMTKESCIYYSKDDKYDSPPVQYIQYTTHSKPSIYCEPFNISTVLTNMFTHKPTNLPMLSHCTVLFLLMFLKWVGFLMIYSIMHDAGIHKVLCSPQREQIRVMCLTQKPWGMKRWLVHTALLAFHCSLLSLAPGRMPVAYLAGRGVVKSNWQVW